METVVISNKKSAHKVYKDNKDHIKHFVTDELPPVYEISEFKAVVPGYEYLWANINYIKGEPVEFWREYSIPVVEVSKQPINLEPILKQDFKRRGEKGLMQRIREIHALHQLQKKTMPQLFETINP